MNVRCARCSVHTRRLLLRAGPKRRFSYCVRFVVRLALHVFLYLPAKTKNRRNNTAFMSSPGQHQRQHVLPVAH
eukprot:3787428-Pyramimonas_sp.AAC.1